MFDIIKSSPGASFMHNARHLEAAARGGGARDSDANSYSNIGSGEVTNLRKCADIDGAIVGKLFASNQRQSTHPYIIGKHTFEQER